MKFILIAILAFYSVDLMAQTPAVSAEASRAFFEVPVAALVPDFNGLEGVLGVEVVAGLDAETQTERTQIVWSSRKINWRGNSIGELQARWTREGEGASRFEADFTGPGVRFDVELEGGVDVDLIAGKLLFRPGELRGSVRAQMADVGVLASVLGWDARGAASLEMTLGGAAEAPKLEGVLTVEGFEFARQKLGRVLVGFDHDAASQVLWKVGDETLGLSGEARLPVELNLVERSWSISQELALNVRGRFDGLNAALWRPFLKVPREISGAVSGTLKAEGSLKELLGEVRVSGPVRVGSKEDRLDLVWESRGAQQTLRGSWGSALGVVANVGVSVLDWWQGESRLAEAAVDGVLKVDLPLSTVEAVVPYLRQGQGAVVGEVGWSGVLGKPELRGRLDLAGAEAMVPALHRRVEAFDGAMEFAGQGWTWRAGGKVAPGTFALEGTGKLARTEGPEGARWTLGLEGDFVASKFPWVQRDFPVGKIDGRGEFGASFAFGRQDVRLKLGRVDVGLLNEALPKSDAIPANPDVVFVEDLEDLEARQSGQFLLEVEALEGIHVGGEGVDATVFGRMAMAREGDVVNVEGGFDVEEGGRLSLFDYPFRLMSGRVTLAPGNLRRPTQLQEDGAFEPAAMEPVIALSAESEVEGTFVLVRLDGTLQRPTLTLASLPAVPEYQIMTLLVTGRLDAVDDRAGNVRKAVAKLVERYHNPSLQRQLFDQLGIDKVGVGFGSSVTEPILTVGKQITKTLYAETVYRHGADTDVNLMEGRIEKRIAQNWTVDSTFGEAAEGRLGVFWRHRFGGPEPEAPSPDAWARYVPPPAGDTDGDGVLNPWDVCVAGKEDLDGFEDEDGCPDVDNDRDGVLDVADAAPDVPETVNGFEDEDGAPDVVPNRLLGFRAEVSPVLFSRNSAVVGREALPRLRTVSRLLGLLGDGLSIEVGGHSDEQGTARTKERVSQARARAVRDALVRAGVDGALIEVVGYSDTAPLDTTGTPEGADRNRRAEIKMTVSETAAEEAPNL